MKSYDISYIRLGLLIKNIRPIYPFSLLSYIFSAYICISQN